MLKPMLESPVITLSGVGLISSKPVTVALQQGIQGQGVQFVFAATGAILPASADLIVDTKRGVTLMHPETKQLLSIVEHFLAAVSLSGFHDITATISGDAPELPLLDGSALPWYQSLISHWGKPPQPIMAKPIHTLKQPVFMRGSSLKTAMYALPAASFSLTYTLDYPHVGFQRDWATWQGRVDESVSVEDLLSAQTFGLVAELPALQSNGLALGVTLENTLGLCEDGISYTRNLKFPKEPFFHKMLDCVGDFHLCGLPVDSLQMAIVAINAGHTSHVAFAQQLKHHLHCL
jgi:UDP-3-O-[3-hydroxymyristoyl] N-acetylglucosamine deacetylase